MKTEIMNRKMYSLAFGSFLVFLSGCGGSFQTAGYVAQGRQALFRGDYQSALGLFQSAAQSDPSYIYGSELREGTLSFLGRAQYLNGQLAPARDTLQKALAEHKSDNVARLYLGLTLARLGDRQSGLQQIEAGLKGIRDFLNYITSAFSQEFGQYWDPNRDIRKAIESALAMISGGNFDWPTLITAGERIGMQIEEEVDRARRDQEQQQQMDRLR
jgi:tetratricopeptide (TPR) repeat protein